jgi:hypothetical protein
MLIRIDTWMGKITNFYLIIQIIYIYIYIYKLKRKTIRKCKFIFHEHAHFPRSCYSFLFCFVLFVSTKVYDKFGITMVTVLFMERCEPIQTWGARDLV